MSGKKTKRKSDEEERVEAAIFVVVAYILILALVDGREISLQLVDIWEMIATGLYFRNKFEFNVDWRGRKLVTERRDILFYLFLSGYFHYNINYQVAQFLLDFDILHFVEFWFDIKLMIKFAFLGVMSAYYFPKDLLYKLFYEHENPLFRLSGDLAMAISKNQSLHLIFKQLYSGSTTGNAINFVFGFGVALINFYSSAVLERVEITFIKGADMKILATDMESMFSLRSPAFHATLTSCTALSVEFFLSHKFTLAHTVLSTLSLCSIFYRFSNDVLWDLKSSHVMFKAVSPKQKHE